MRSRVFIPLALALVSVGFSQEPEDLSASGFDRSVLDRLGRLWSATRRMITLVDTTGWSGDVRTIADVARELPDSLIVGYTYSAWDENDTRRDSSLVDLRWVKENSEALVGREFIDTAHVRTLHEGLDALILALEATQWSSYEKDDTPYADRLRTILERDEFRQEENRNLLTEILRKAMSWLADWLNRLFGNRTDEPPTQVQPWDFRTFGRILLIVVVVLGGIALIWLIRKVLLHFRSRRPRRVGQEVERVVPFLEAGETADPDVHRRLADEWSGRGDYRRAIRHLFLSIILGLDESRRVRYREPWTNSEFMNAIRGHEDERIRRLAGGLEILTAAFERTWYGMQQATWQEYQAVLSVWDSVQNEIRETHRV